MTERRWGRRRAPFLVFNITRAHVLVFNNTRADCIVSNSAKAPYLVSNGFNASFLVSNSTRTFFLVSNRARAPFLVPNSARVPFLVSNRARASIFSPTVSKLPKSCLKAAGPLTTCQCLYEYVKIYAKAFFDFIHFSHIIFILVRLPGMCNSFFSCILLLLEPFFLPNMPYFG